MKKVLILIYYYLISQFTENILFRSRSDSLQIEYISLEIKLIIKHNKIYFGVSFFVCEEYTKQQSIFKKVPLVILINQGKYL